MKVTCFVAFSIIICSFCAVKSEEWEPLNPEETLFVYSRCIEDNFNGELERVPVWADWKLEPEDESTACYVKCALTGLGLFDEESVTFRGDHIDAQHQKYKHFTQVDDEQAKQYKEAVEALGTLPDSSCESVLSAYKQVHADHLDASRSIFHGRKSTNRKIYDADTDNNIKKEDETYFAFCEKKYYPVSENKDELCKIRKYGIDVNDDSFGPHTDCLFRGLRYLDRKGNINADEIKRDFKQVGLDKDVEIDNALQNCEESTALGFYKCLVQDASLQADFPKAFDYREIRSKDYGYKLKAENLDYDADKIAAEVKTIDTGLGCN